MKKFLTVFAGIAAAFASNASTSVATSPSISAHSMDSQNIAAPQTVVLGENISTIDSNGDQFNFVLKKSADTGLMMAYHSSHASHASHSSHYSSR